MRQKVAVSGNIAYDFIRERDSSVRKEADINALTSYDKKQPV